MARQTFQESQAFPIKAAEGLRQRLLKVHGVTKVDLYGTALVLELFGEVIAAGGNGHP